MMSNVLRRGVRVIGSRTAVFQGIGAAALLAGLAGCAPTAPKPAAVAPRQLPPHAGPPAAAHCMVAPFSVADGGSATVNMTLVNDGGYCAARATAGSGKPFDAPLVPVPPSHGTAAVWRYDGKTSVEYVPDAGFAGSDQFVTKLIIAGKPGYTTLTVAVTVLAPGTAIPEPPAAK